MQDVGIKQRTAPREFVVALAALWLIALAACSPSDGAAKIESPGTLTIGFGLSTGENPESGLRLAVRNIAVEGLVNFAQNGRPEPWLAEKWAKTPDGLTWKVSLRPHSFFHDGSPVDAATVAGIVAKNLPDFLGPAFEDVEIIRATTERELEIKLKRPSTFLLEGLELFIERPGPTPIGTGPFYPTAGGAGGAEMLANSSYHQGRPLIDRIVFKPYGSVRSAWADMLRGQVDMLFDVGVEALDFLEPSTTTKIYTFPRPYAYQIVLNVRKPPLTSIALRRAMNEGIDRGALVTQALHGHGAVADTPIWPHHWAYDASEPGFNYEPRRLANPSEPIRFTCLLVDPADERMALAVQRQLRAIGVEVVFEKIPFDQFFKRMEAGNFDAYLAAAQMGPNMLRAYQFWRTDSPYNWGGFSSPAVDRGLDALRGAATDEEYRRGLAQFQRAMIEDPPAIFLAWTQRARAVSSRFIVPEEAGRDILTALRRWRPISGGEEPID